jgi:tetratricopeptide (TPR) repeat protein
MRKTLLALTCASLLTASAYAQSMPGMEHHHSHPEEAEQLGHVSFPTSCAARWAAPMERGVALLHSFGYTEAQLQFTAIVQDDPSCAMAHWGIAMTQYKELWGHPTADELKLGAREMAHARALTATPRERAYIDALSAFFDEADALFQKRADAYAAGMDKLHHDYPDDVEGAAFSALATLASVAPDDTSLNKEHAALAILVPLFAAHPEHPGLAHYIIHTCDTPALAPEGLSAAREYAKIAPSSAHATHMPGHIFARLGMWQEDIASNVASVKASEKAEAAGQPGSAHQMHAQEFLIYADLQVGDDAKARVLAEQMRGVGQRMSAMPGMDDMKDDGGYFDNEVRAVYAAEMHDWKALAMQTPAPGTRPDETFFTYWGQGIAAGHLKDAKLAAAALKGFDESYDAVRKSERSEYSSALAVKRDEMVGWQAYAEGHDESAVAAMRKAADQQDKLGQMEVDIPAREMLGDVLMLEHKPSEALTEYRVALKLSPNRLNGLLSAGAAAEAIGKPDEATAFYKVAAQQTDMGAHTSRPEVARAVKVSNTAVAAMRAQ